MLRIRMTDSSSVMYWNSDRIGCSMNGVVTELVSCRPDFAVSMSPTFRPPSAYLEEMRRAGEAKPAATSGYVLV